MARKKKPILITIDDEIEVLNAIERDLQKHFSKEYRVMKANSGDEGLDIVKRLKQRGDLISLFLCDQRMPEMEGTEFLNEAKKFYPDAKMVLLTAYADTQAAIKSINEIGLDFYLTKPWDPPEQHLFPVLDDLLEDWNANSYISFDSIRVAGNLWSAPSHVVKDFLARNRVPYQWLDVEKDSSVHQLLDSVKQDVNTLPVVFFEDGSHLVTPSKEDLAEKIGLHTTADEPFYDLIVIGAGPAGLAAGVYGASEGLRTICIEKQATGGQAGTSSRIENYLGFPKGLSGADLARRATTQAERLGAEILLTKEVVEITLDGPYKVVKLNDGQEIQSHALIIATGVEVNEFKCDGIDGLHGAGVYYGAALTEASFYRNREVYVLGGGNSAGQGAMFFSRYASKVNIVVRRDSLVETMSSYLIDQLDAQPNVELIPNTTIEKLIGEERLDKIVLKNNKTNKLEEVDAAALFIFIGAAPRTKIVKDLVKRDGGGYIITGMDLIEDGKVPGKYKGRFPFTFETSVPGIFAAGDVRSGSSKRVAAAVGEGAVTVQLVHEFLKTV